MRRELFFVLDIRILKIRIYYLFLHFIIDTTLMREGN